MPDLNDFFSDESSINDHRYICFPNKKNPRLMVHIKNYDWYKKGLLFQNTASVKNRVLKFILIYSYWLVKYAKENIVSYTELVEKIKTALAENVISEEISLSSFFIGTPENENRKISAQILNKDNKFMGVIKFPLSRKSVRFIKNEYNALNELQKIDFEKIIVPKTFLFSVKDELIVLYETDIFANSQSIALNLNQSIVEASLDLSKKTKKDSLEKYFKDLGKSISILPIDKVLLAKYQKAREIVIKENIPSVLIHGDYVMYNMRQKDNKLALIDWEFSRYGLPLFDLFHFIFQGLTQVKNKNLKNTIRTLFNKKNMDVFSKYLREFGKEAYIIKDIFIMYLFDNLVFENRLKPNMNIRASNYYNALFLV